jgi:formylmethanofuran dehydrogenase subunit B
MNNNKIDKSTRLEAINKAADYFVNELKPIYDECYAIMCKMEESTTKSINIVEDVNFIIDHQKKLNESNEVLKIKQNKFNILKDKLDVHDIKLLDNKIKEMSQD